VGYLQELLFCAPEQAEVATETAVQIEIQTF
jgi:hypothetical protein